MLDLPVIKSSDLLLTNSIKDIQNNYLSNNYIESNSKDINSKTLLSSIKLYEAYYDGVPSITSDYSCQILAFGLKDRYNPDTKRLNLKTFVDHDYFSIISSEISQNRTLLAFDKSWILHGIIKYIQEDITYSIDEPVLLRQKLATYNSEEWSNVSPQKNPSDIFNVSDISIYNLDDMMMIFAPVNRDEAEKIFLYLYRDVQLYTITNYITLKDVPKNKIKDFEYLFPVDVKFFGDYTFISSDQMTFQKLQHAYNFGEIQFEFPHLDELKGSFASYLLAERTSFQYSIKWENNTLYVGLCGYIQAMDLFTTFGQILIEIQKERLYYKEVPNYRTATSFITNTNFKAFYYLGKYYVALDLDQEIPILSQNDNNYSITELSLPLITSDSKEYLKNMGYDITPSSYHNDLKVNYQTYETSTIYYYDATYEKEIELYEIKGKYDVELQNKLERLLQEGFFFTQKMKNITKGYPGFTPSDVPINKLF